MKYNKFEDKPTAAGDGIVYIMTHLQTNPPNVNMVTLWLSHLYPCALVHYCMLLYVLISNAMGRSERKLNLSKERESYYLPESLYYSRHIGLGSVVHQLQVWRW